ncbi:MAG TPA: metallophosphoesterase [Anaeromyxobacteraceae bacterium]|nr:metallophosphoesterase [Anaeromyxobacteraceae bacterium]
MASRTLVGALATALAAACATSPAPYREPGALSAPTRTEPPTLRVAVLGDFGAHTPRQRRVARTLLRSNDRRPLDLVLQPGDNLYNCGPNPRLPGADACRFGPDASTLVAGVAPPDDPHFERNEGPLRALSRRDGRPTPIFLALGNHDVGELRSCRVPGLARDEWMRRRACLEVARRSPQWRMPGRHYVLDEGPVRFIVIDSNVAVADYGGFTLAAEEAFVEEASAGCAERTCFLVAHHPPALALSAPHTGEREPGIVRMRRVVAAAHGRLAGVLAGHAHALEHLVLDGTDVFIAGGGARGEAYPITAAWPPDARLRFGCATGGFGVLEAWSGGWSLRFVDDHGRPLHCCEAIDRGPCQPVACADAP